MSQEIILERMIAFLNKKRLEADKSKRRDVSPQLIQSLRVGHCQGFSLCYGMMDWLDRNYPKSTRKNIARWLAMLDHITRWDMDADPDEIECEIPALTSSVPTEKMKLTLILDLVISVVVESNALGGIDFIPQRTTQQEFTQPEEKKEIHSEMTPRRLELAVNNPSELSGQVFKIEQCYESVEVHADPALYRDLLKQDLEDKITQSHIMAGICILNMSNSAGAHCCYLSFEKDSRRWLFYDPSYPDDQAKSFENTDDLIREIYRFYTVTVFKIQYLTGSEIPPGSPFKALDEKKNGFKRSIWWRFRPEAASNALEYPQLILEDELWNYLCMAVRYNTVDLMKRLLMSIKLVSSFTQKDDEVNTLLHSAVKNSSIEILNLLLIAFPDFLNKKDDKGNTLLHEAIKKGRLSMVEYLLNRGADARIQNKEDLTALHLSANESNDPEIIRLILEKFPGLVDEVATESKLTALHIAALKGNEAVVSRLLEHKANSAILTPRGNTALHAATFAKNVHSLGEILRRHPKLLNAENPFSGYTPLMSAICRNNIAAVSYLMEQKASLDVRNNTGTVLHLAAIYSSKTIVKMLLACKPDLLNSPDSEECGNRPLHYAARAGNIEALKYLLEQKDVDILGKNKEGFSPLDLALINGHSTCILELMSRMDKEALRKAMDSENIEILYKLLYHSKKTLGECRTLLYACLAKKSGQVQLPGVKVNLEHKIIDSPSSDFTYRILAHELLSSALKTVVDEIKDQKKREITEYLIQELNQLKLDAQDYWRCFAQLFMDAQRVLSHHTRYIQSRSSTLPQSYRKAEPYFKAIAVLPEIESRMREKLQENSVLVMKVDELERTCHPYSFFAENLVGKNLVGGVPYYFHSRSVTAS